MPPSNQEHLKSAKMEMALDGSENSSVVEKGAQDIANGLLTTAAFQALPVMIEEYRTGSGQERFSGLSTLDVAVSNFCHLLETDPEFILKNGHPSLASETKESILRRWQAIEKADGRVVKTSQGTRQENEYDWEQLGRVAEVVAKSRVQEEVAK